MATMDDLLELADRNMVATWTALTAKAGGDRVEGESLVLLSTGLPIAMFNVAFLVGTPAGGADAAADVVGAARAHSAERGLPFALYFRDAVAPGVAAACEAAGLVEHWQPPLMVLDTIPPEDEPLPDRLVIEDVTAATYDDYLGTLAVGFGIPVEVVAPVLGPKLLDIPGFTAMLGRVDGAPVATSAVAVTGPTAGVYNIATHPDHRRRGYGVAVTAAAARRGADAGCTHAALQASEAGEPVYRRMGYATPDRYRQFEG
jgi:GNAT superfamily N-acetyltransferase